MHLDKIPPLAWVAIAFVVVFTVIVNFILLAFLRDPQGLRRAASQKRMLRSGHTAETLKKATEVLRAPFAEENRQLNELASLVHGLQNSGRPAGPVGNNQNPVLPKK